MNENTFESIINKSESSILDFKAKMYDFSDDKDLIKIAKFIKDIIAFSNTIRNESSFIIIGIKEEDDGTKQFYGLNKFVDDSILQDKVKDKVYPRPHFKFYTFDHDSKRYGIIEFPVVKYPTPITPTTKLKGLVVGQVYYRHGTTNAEATGLEVIRINDWMRNLPDANTDSNINEEVTNIIKQLTSRETKLSVIISEVLALSKKYDLKDLTDYCTYEIKGITKTKIDATPDSFKYRIQKVYISLDKIEINPYSFIKVTANMIKSEMENNDHFFEFRLLFNNPISEIEDYIERISNNPDSFGSFQMSSRQIFQGKENKDYPITVYVFGDTFKDLYRSIRQKMIDRLIEI